MTYLQYPLLDQGGLPLPSPLYLFIQYVAATATSCLLIPALGIAAVAAFQAHVRPAAVEGEELGFGNASGVFY